MQENKKADKQVRISYENHRELKKMSVQEDKEMRDILNEAFEFYMQHYNKQK